MGCRCASRVKVPSTVFSSFPTCYMIASVRASRNFLCVIHVLRVPVFCLHRCFWMHVLHYPCFACSFQLQLDRFWAWTSTSLWRRQIRSRATKRGQRKQEALSRKQVTDETIEENERCVL